MRNWDLATNRMRLISLMRQVPIQWAYPIYIYIDLDAQLSYKYVNTFFFSSNQRLNGMILQV